jgi:hypothetical protein
MEDGDALHSVFAESSMSSQSSNPFAEKVTNSQVFFQLMPAESSPAIADTSSQGSDPPVRKKIKRTNGFDSSEAQQAQRKNADTACSERVCMKIDGKKLNINGKTISLGSKESAFLNLLFEKRNIYVPIDDLYVAVHEGRAGDWKKISKKERACFYSLIYSLRKKLPKDCLEGEFLKGYMLSDFVMTSRSGFAASSILKLLSSKISAS